MKKYDYFEAVKNDVMTYINENYDNDTLHQILITEERADEFNEELYDKLWVEDSVTGNASGSYTFNRWNAEENICHNLELLIEAYTEFGFTIQDTAIKLYVNGPEHADVTIRCYLLSRAISRAIEEIENRLADERISRKEVR